MNLPPNFQFSQGVLQDFVDCRRRFQLRYLQQLDWPAIVADPVLQQEQHLQLGTQFHRLVQQHQLGLPEDKLARLADAPDLKDWWQHYLAHAPPNLPQQRHLETVLSAPLGEHRLLAKYDLVAVDPGRRAVIVDWKTNQHRPKRDWLSQRLQTRVYRHLLVKTGTHLNGGRPLEPEQVEMVYWFANFPQDAEHFAYDTMAYEADEAYLVGLAETIQRLGEDEFPLTDHERRCRFCTYRSLCDRGTAAGTVAGDDAELDVDESLALELDLEHIAEIEF